MNKPTAPSAQPQTCLSCGKTECACPKYQSEEIGTPEEIRQDAIDTYNQWRGGVDKQRRGIIQGLLISAAGLFTVRTTENSLQNLPGAKASLETVEISPASDEQIAQVFNALWDVLDGGHASYNLSTPEMNEKVKKILLARLHKDHGDSVKIVFREAGDHLIIDQDKSIYDRNDDLIK